MADPAGVKPGYRTTELAFAGLGFVLTALVATGRITVSDQAAIQGTVQAVATGVSGLIPSVYAVARAVTKASGGR